MAEPSNVIRAGRQAPGEGIPGIIGLGASIPSGEFWRILKCSSNNTWAGIPGLLGLGQVSLPGGFGGPQGSPTNPGTPLPPPAGRKPPPFPAPGAPYTNTPALPGSSVTLGQRLGLVVWQFKDTRATTQSTAASRSSSERSGWIHERWPLFADSSAGIFVGWEAAVERLG